MAQNGSWIKYVFKKVILRGVFLYSGCMVLNKYVGSIIFLTGDSMHPTIYDGDVVFTRTYNPRKHEIKKNDIVCVKSPTDRGILICKRVALLEHEYDNISFNDIRPSTRIAAGHCFLLGDNLYSSSDSRAFGPIPMGLIFSRVTYRIWPPNRIGFIEK
uniref:Peptidase S26 domain-containing protein n=1 Tax=Panagrolaimus sp. PS1159 TaxID=55785 RepID=A0AC35FJ47_9BILA